MEPTLKVSRLDDGAVVSLELDHGKANEIGVVQLDELDALVASLNAGPAVALVTWSRRVSSRGTPLFIAGANVTERVGWSDAAVKAHVRRQRETLAALRRAPVLHVVVVGGVAFGWGTELTLAADYVIAADGARFALPETGLGILPGAGGSTELQRRIGPAHALRLGMTGEVIDAAEAARIGLVQERCATVDDALARAMALARMAATRSPTALAAFKGAVIDSAGLGWDARRELEAVASERCVDSGDAAIGRAWFAAGGGEAPAWGPRRGGA